MILRYRLIWVLFLLLFASLGLAQNYTIRSFDVRIDLEKGGAMNVEERLEVVFTIPQRGIFRHIPAHLESGKGTTRSIFVSDIRVTDETNRDLTTDISHQNDSIVIRVGDEDIFLDPERPYTYVIRYRVFGMMNWHRADDWEPSAELYWNVTGHEWESTIERSSLRLTFPKVEDPKRVRAIVFPGHYGSSDSVLQRGAGTTSSSEHGIDIDLSQDVLEVRKPGPLSPFSGWTVALSLPEDTIERPGPFLAAWLFLRSNLGFFIPLMALILMPIFWFRHGKDPQTGPLVVQFDPPERLSGAEIGTLLDERVDQRDLAAGIISLAVKGYVKIHPKEEGLIFKKRSADLEVIERTAGPNLDVFEAALLRRLSSSGVGLITSSDLRTGVAPYVQELRSKVYQALVDRGFYATSPEKARTGWVVGMLLLFGFFAFIAFMLAPGRNPIPAMVGFGLSALIVFAWSPGMPRRTKAGALAWQQARGFEEFMRRARSKELEWMTKKHPDQALFEMYLPHAVALGLTKEWAEAFEGIVQQMPDWYVAPHGTVFHAAYFGNDMVTITESLGSSASLPPRSSGASGGGSGFSSGGGFSGGGFGGGGGGSW